MDKRDYKGMWVYIEHDGSAVAKVGLELCCEARRLCDETGESLSAVIVGTLPESEHAKVRECGVDKLIFVSGKGTESFDTEVWANIFTVLSKKCNPSAIFVGGTSAGRDFAPRFAVRLDTGCTSDAMELKYDAETGDIEFIEPAVGGKIMAVITLPVLRPQVGTIRPGTFKYAPAGERDNVEVIHERVDYDKEIRCRVLSFAPDESDPELDISDCEVIVCLGNGLKNKESLERYRKLAKLLGGKIGCTRPLFDRGILPYKLQIGQSGVMVKPKLFIAFGVSGAVNHVAGVSADCFVAVNTDPEAQIFNYADYGIVGDMDEVCDAWIRKIEAGE